MFSMSWRDKDTTVFIVISFPSQRFGKIPSLQVSRPDPKGTTGLWRDSRRWMIRSILSKLAGGRPPSETQYCVYGRQLTKPGLSTSVRFSFAFLRDDECNGDVTPTEQMSRRMAAISDVLSARFCPPTLRGKPRRLARATCLFRRGTRNSSRQSAFARSRQPGLHLHGQPRSS